MGIGLLVFFFGGGFQVYGSCFQGCVNLLFYRPRLFAHTPEYNYKKEIDNQKQN